MLDVTGDALALGLVIALMSVPRALFMLVGGALVDRHSPRLVLLLTKYAGAVLLGLLAVLTWRGQATLPVLYTLALATGLAQAFAIPAATSILPRAVPAPLLQGANGMMMGLRQLSLLAGPLLAAALLAFSGGAGKADTRTLALAFAVDCASFVLSAWTLARVKPLPAQAAPEGQSVLRAVGAGLAMVWRDVPLRTCFLYWGLVSFFVGGSMQVALPLLASETLHSAPAYALLLGAHGAGTLLGMAVAALLPRLAVLPFGAMLLAGDAVAGMLLAPLGIIDTAFQGALLLALGILGGYLQVAIFTWIGRRVPAPMLGRAMSIFLFIFMGLAPLSAAGTGWVLQHVSLPQLFAAGGAMLVCCAVLAWTLTPMRAIGADGADGADRARSARMTP